MGLFKKTKTNKIIFKFTILTILSLFFIGLFQWKNTLVYKANDNTDTTDNKEITDLIDNIFENRNKALLKGDLEFIESIYDTSTKYGVWAYEHEKKKIKYLSTWEKKQGVKFTDIKPKVVIRRINRKKDKCSINLLCCTEYKYVYEDSPEKVNTSIIGTNHLVSLAKQYDEWVITKEWYKDPFADSLNIDNFKKPNDMREYILSNSSRDFSDLNERRLNCVEYANKYCGTASNGENEYKYNKKYRNYNPQGGDCANFASQILLEGGKFRKNSAWNYDANGATRAWVNADGFKDYMIHSGRASVIAHGSYEKVYKASYKLLPGDFVAYEKKGDITHISVVTGADSKGYSLVSCHNTDRNKVPWDLGWNDKKIKFWLVRVHF
ncbi:amidase domain-containing protein [Clostridium botulinum]|nr:amidase domain-containing protein [Clostridium botulinum]